MTTLDSSAASDLSAALDRLDEALACMGSGDPAPDADPWADGEPLLMTLRVTHVLRRVDGRWRLVHRHGDLPPADQRG
jgi:hypothetical protein